MAIHSTGLGRGLDALIRETQELQEGGVRMLPLCDIHPNPRQPRRNFNEKPMEELANITLPQDFFQKTDAKGLVLSRGRNVRLLLPEKVCHCKTGNSTGFLRYCPGCHGTAKPAPLTGGFPQGGAEA